MTILLEQNDTIHDNHQVVLTNWSHTESDMDQNDVNTTISKDNSSIDALNDVDITISKNNSSIDSFNDDFNNEINEVTTQLITAKLIHDREIQFDGCIEDMAVPTTASASHDVGVQVTSDFNIPNFVSSIRNDQDLSSVTGLESFAVLNAIIKAVEMI